MSPTKIDLKRDLRGLYSPGLVPALVDVPPLQYLMIDGHGDPNTAAEYQDAVHALCALAYAVKSAAKKAADGGDFTVMPLEGLWWAADSEAFTEGDKSAWDWTLMIAQPELVTAGLVEQARVAAAPKMSPAAAAAIRLERFHEGRCAEVLHKGPYAAESPTIALLLSFVAEHGYVPAGKHHEIYLSDPNRSAPDKLRTIIRQPVCRTRVG